MDLRETKELLSEELALLKRVQFYLKGHAPNNNRERIDNVVLLLLYRVYSNLYSATHLTASALKRKALTFFQLPIGIVLRCVFSDCLFTLFILRTNKEVAYEELDIRTIEYANSLLERREVYKDQVKSTGFEFDDSFIEHMWELEMEDNFLHLLTFDENKKDLEVTKRSKNQLQEDGFSIFKSTGIKEQKDFLIKQNDIKPLAMRLYHYYKYFSQYEHFSENGQGDVLESLKEDGNDNIHLPSAIKAIGAAVEEIIKNRECFS